MPRNRGRDAGRTRRLVLIGGMGAILVLGSGRPTLGQFPTTATGEVVPRDVREMYDKGLQYLATSQTEQGDWGGGGEQGAGVTGMAVLALLASGEDPNFGLYSNQIRKGLRAIVLAQDGEHRLLRQQHVPPRLRDAGTGRSLWRGRRAEPLAARRRPPARSARRWSWRSGRRSPRRRGTRPTPGGISPTARDADTSVSGAVLVGLLAARNAGIEVPDEAIDKAVAYFKSMTSKAGQVAYTGGLGGFGDSMARSSIATLSYAIARRKDLDEYKATLGYIKERIEQPPGGYLEYVRYYEAQALFQGDLEAWEKWNKLLVRQLKEAQAADGSIRGQFGPTISTSLSLLSLALNYRFLPIYER